MALESKNLESYCLETIQNVSKGLQNCQHEVAADEESQLQICDLNSAVELCDKNKVGTRSIYFFRKAKRMATGAMVRVC